jgi:Ankyrin repeats (3 copies)
MSGAVRCNKLAEVQHLHEQGCPWSMNLLEQAAREGHFELVRWCYEHGCSWHEISKAPAYAAESGNVELMAWVLQLPGTALHSTVMNAAAAKGHKAMCQFLHDQQCSWDTYATAHAALEGHVNLLRWLIDSGCPWAESQLCMAAALSGNMELMTHLQQEGLLLSLSRLTFMLSYAGGHNKLAAAQWLREQGAQWPTAFTLPWNGKVLEWARAEGCTTPTN